jgi:predicted DNA repair protein MutK
VIEITDPKELEDRQVSGAVRTDFILSAEIMAIALAGLPELSLVQEAVVLAAVGIAITVGVYGVVALIVKMDDIGLHLAQRNAAIVRAVGRGLVAAMPVLLQTLAAIGTAAMIWVGGGIIIHGLEVLGWGAVAHWLHGAAQAVGHVPPVGGAIVEWIATAAGSAIAGLVVGGLIVAVMQLAHRAR